MKRYAQRWDSLRGLCARQGFGSRRRGRQWRRLSPGTPSRRFLQGLAGVAADLFKSLAAPLREGERRSDLPAEMAVNEDRCW